MDDTALLNRAKGHWAKAQDSTLLFAADLRRLQVCQAHLAHGVSNFGEFAEREFDGLSAAMTQRLSTQGKVLLALEHRGRLSLDAPLPVTTTGTRELAPILNQHDEPKMLAVFDDALALNEGRAVSEKAVKAVMRRHLPSQRHDDIPAPHDYGDGFWPGIATELALLDDRIQAAADPLMPEERQAALAIIADLETRLAKWKRHLASLT